MKEIFSSRPQEFFRQLIIVVFLTSSIISGYANVYTVTNNNDNGTGSLRQAMLDANTNSGADTISFNISTASVSGRTIKLSTALPVITETLVIDGSTQANGNTFGASNAKVIIDGDSVVADGIVTTALGMEIYGLYITRFTDDAIYINGDGADNFIIGAPGKGNVISDNTDEGIFVNAADNYIIQGNFIGTDTNGTIAEGNARGIFMDGSCSGGKIGGTTAGERNIISGNNGSGTWDGGIYVDGLNDTIYGNYIGTDITGTTAIPNKHGIGISTLSKHIHIGGTSINMRNIISGSVQQGIESCGDSVYIKGNYIGTDLNGTTDLGNGLDGIWITSGSLYGIIGGTTTAERNIISGNNDDGIQIDGDNFSVYGNYIGIDATGDSCLGNGNDGIFYIGTAKEGTIGGSTTAHKNIIGCNGDDGVHVDGDNINTRGNYIGVDPTGIYCLGNSNDGIFYGGAGVSGTIGGNTSSERNLVSCNGEDGIHVDGDTIITSGNYVGVNATATACLGNGNDGIFYGGAARSGVIGGYTSAYRNIVGCNTDDGIHVDGDNVITIGNYVGVDISGNNALGNQNDGIVYGGIANPGQIGDTATGARNIISGNVDDGVDVGGDNIVLYNNHIGLNAAGTSALGNGGEGIINQIAANYMVVGGSEPKQRNIISANGGQGMELWGDNQLIQGNFIGTDATGTIAMGNGSDGILTTTGVIGMKAGGDQPGEGNVISNNNGAGIFHQGDQMLVQGNLIGTDITGTIDMGNAVDGINISQWSHNDTIGGYTYGARNIISGNGEDGIEVHGDLAVIKGNFIGTDINGLTALSNSGHGIHLSLGFLYSSEQTIIGGTNPAERNIISGNGLSGIYSNGDNDTIMGNYIGVDSTGLIAIGNGEYGIHVWDDEDYLYIGGSTERRNIIAGNNWSGIKVEGDDVIIQSNYIGINKAGNVVPNDSCGIWTTWEAQNIQIGGEKTQNQGNVIGGNGDIGIKLIATDNAKIYGNYIGTNESGTANLANGSHGIKMMNDGTDYGQNNTVGNKNHQHANTIANNNGSAVYLGYQGAGTYSHYNRYNSILGNSMYNNATPGITYQAANINEGQTAPTVTTQTSSLIAGGNVSTGDFIELHIIDGSSCEGKIVVDTLTATTTTYSFSGSFVAGTTYGVTATTMGGSTSPFGCGAGVLQYDDRLLVAPYWPMDVCYGGNMTDTTGNNNFKMTEPNWQESYHNVGPYFNGVTTYGELFYPFLVYPYTYSQYLLIENQISIGLWVKGIAQNNTIFSYYDENDQKGYKIYSINDKLGVFISQDQIGSTDSIMQYESSKTVFDDQWHHIYTSFDKGDLKIYIDGIEDTIPTKVHDASITHISSLDVSRVLLGAHYNNGTPTGFFNGELDELNIAFRPNTSLEINNWASVVNDPGCCLILNSEKLEGEQDYSLSGSLEGLYVSGKIEGIPYNISSDETIEIKGVNLDTVPSLLDDLFAYTTITFDLGQNCHVDNFQVIINDPQLDTTLVLPDNYYEQTDTNTVVFEIIEESEQTDTTFLIEFNLGSDFIISPNGDGNHDQLEIDVSTTLSNFTISILDEIGNVVFQESNNHSTVWNGMDYQNEVLVEEGPYFIKIEEGGEVFWNTMLIAY